MAVLLPDGAAVHVAFVAAEREGLTVVGIGHRAGPVEVGHLLDLTAAADLVALADDHDRIHDRARLARVVVDGDGRCTKTPGSGPSPSAPAGEPVPAGRAFGPDDLFLLNSTSGTTGLPKCVMHNQNRWIYFHQQAAAAGRMTGDDVFLSALPAPFGFGLWTAHVTPAVLGCPTVVRERFDADAALRAVERERVTGDRPL